MFRCDQCGKCLKLDFKRIVVDMLVKDYTCKNGHKTILKRYGSIIEVNGKKHTTTSAFDLTKAQNEQTLKRENDFKFRQMQGDALC